ncbi:pre-rRNA-processing protein TSR2 homolog [Cydia fagiglandana]|uniref:pre-rRNA-processing protein TSR2 homolog n=1 Tax=Cydia fagiglandana TaxID=1458189 RepID=UPI002FEDEC20
MLYDQFKPLVDLVLNNWTALQLAVEQGMGAPGGEKTAQLMSVYVARYCVENIVDIENVTEVLEDLMDEEFETVCHDNSPKEVATLLLQYLALLKEGRQEELQARVAAMPACRKWLNQPACCKSIPPQSHGNPDDDTTSSSDEDNLSNRPLNSKGSSVNYNTEREPVDKEKEPVRTIVRTRKKRE